MTRHRSVASRAVAASTSDDRRIPTVVIARRVAPGKAAEFSAWIDRLDEAVRQHPGYLHAEFQPPDDRHPDEWVATFQFSSSVALEAWLDSPDRRALMEEGRDLIVGDPQPHVIGVNRPVGVRPVTAVISSRIKPGSEAAYRAVHEDIVTAMRATEGFLHSELFEAVPGVQRDNVVVFSFDTRNHLDAWLHSAVRSELIARLEPLVEGDRRLDVVGGYAGWFSVDDTTVVKRWKQAVAVILGLFPISVAITLVRNRVAPGLPLVPGILLGNIVGTLALTYLVMPRITRLLNSWLQR